MIGKVGFGRDFAASGDIDNPVNTFQMLTDDLEEGVIRLINPWRKYSRSQVSPRLTPLTHPWPDSTLPAVRPVLRRHVTAIWDIVYCTAFRRCRKGVAPSEAE